MTRLLFTLLLAFACLPVFAQPGARLSEGSGITIDGIEYGFTIRRESKKDVGDKGTFSRYEITAYATNKSGCPKIIWLNQNNINENSKELARFDCTNATGYRLTAKSTTLRVQEFWVPVKSEYKDSEGKIRYEVKRMMAGFALQDGESIRDNFIVIVPLGEKPDLKVTVLGQLRGF
jgi:hypothetical protein